QKAQAKQYDKNKKGHKLQVGERVLWFRPQDLSGDDRKFALPYIGPYIVTELKGLNNVFIRLENSTQEPFLVNVDQLSRCYAGLSMEGPLQFSHTTKPRRANRGRKVHLKEDIEQTQPNHQMTLRQTRDLNFDGNINSISTYVLDETKGEKGPDGSEPLNESESGSVNWESQADGGGVIFEKVQVDPMTQHQALLDEEKWLSVTKDDLSSQAVEDPSGKEASSEKKSKSDVESDVKSDVTLRVEVYIEDVEGVMREEGVSWDWGRRKKLPNCEF
ncbi:MAG: hypothetical protein GY821_05815, partial [Gammaproteobacteria bacterium]|nr:hypothetical protein [Gammaproteobacteria bacterium]